MYSGCVELLPSTMELRGPDGVAGRQVTGNPRFSRNSSKTPQQPGLHYFPIGDNTTATRIEMQSVNEDREILDVPFK
jgi:hypothetical protein